MLDGSLMDLRQVRGIERCPPKALLGAKVVIVTAENGAEALLRINKQTEIRPSAPPTVQDAALNLGHWCEGWAPTF